MITEERCDIMMMMVVPTQILQQEINYFFGYCFHSLIRKFTKFISYVCNVVLDYF